VVREFEPFEQIQAGKGSQQPMSGCLPETRKGQHMKTKPRKVVRAGFAALLLGAIGGMVVAAEKTPEKAAMTAFMRTKLAYTQGVTEGMTMEKFDLVMSNAVKLRDMTQSNVWTMVKEPEYPKLTSKYQNNCDVLYKSAASKDLDKVTKAYVKVLNSCVECHRVLRAKHSLHKK
jgi:cytochrome c556